MFNQDFKDMLSALSEARADFLLVGAYALAVHGHPRATGDLDIWVRADSENAPRVLRSLSIFGLRATSNESVLRFVSMDRG